MLAEPRPTVTSNHSADRHSAQHAHTRREQDFRAATSKDSPAHIRPTTLECAIDFGNATSLGLVQAAPGTLYSKRPKPTRISAARAACQKGSCARCFVSRLRSRTSRLAARGPQLRCAARSLRFGASLVPFCPCVAHSPPHRNFGPLHAYAKLSLLACSKDPECAHPSV